MFRLHFNLDFTRPLGSLSSSTVISLLQPLVPKNIIYHIFIYSIYIQYKLDLFLKRLFDNLFGRNNSESESLRWRMICMSLSMMMYNAHVGGVRMGMRRVRLMFVY